MKLKIDLALYCLALCDVMLMHVYSSDRRCMAQGEDNAILLSSEANSACIFLTFEL